MSDNKDITYTSINGILHFYKVCQGNTRLAIHPWDIRLQLLLSLINDNMPENKHASTILQLYKNYKPIMCNMLNISFDSKQVDAHSIA